MVPKLRKSTKLLLKVERVELNWMDTGDEWLACRSRGLAQCAGIPHRLRRLLTHKHAGTLLGRPIKRVHCPLEQGIENSCMCLPNACRSAWTRCALSSIYVTEYPQWWSVSPVVCQICRRSPSDSSTPLNPFFWSHFSGLIKVNPYTNFVYILSHIFPWLFYLSFVPFSRWNYSNAPLWSLAYSPAPSWTPCRWRVLRSRNSHTY